MCLPGCTVVRLLVGVCGRFDGVCVNVCGCRAGVVCCWRVVFCCVGLCRLGLCWCVCGGLRVAFCMSMVVRVVLACVVLL